MIAAIVVDVPSPLAESIVALGPITRRGDLAAFQRIFNELGRRGPTLGPDQLSEAIEELVEVLKYRPSGVFARLALVAGAFVEWGGSPMSLVDNVPACTLASMYLREAFTETWPLVGGGAAEPDRGQPPAMNDLIEVFRSKAEEVGLVEDAAVGVALSWFDIDHWVSLMITLLVRREFRMAAGLRTDIAEHARSLADRVPECGWLASLAEVLDDETLVVLDHETGRGYRLTMSGIGDNFQLHTLLADRLIGKPSRGLLPGKRPERSWVAAASTAPPALPPGQEIERRFRIFDGTGTYIHPEGKPADIAPIDGMRVIVLHPPGGSYRWNNGRTFEHMVPTLTLDAMLRADEAAAWRERIQPARETDLLGAG